jgi:DNA-binding CsgD family transcriptional regulator
MSQLTALFKDYCKQNITARALDLSPEQKNNIVSNLRSSPFSSVVQAWSLLDFYDYKHLWAQGFDTYFGYKNDFITAENILEMVHPEDQEAFGQLYYLCLEGLMNMPIPTKNIGHFCISYRMRDVNGNYHKILETNNIIECDPKANIPLINLAQISILNKSQANQGVYYYFKIKDENGSVDIMSSYLNQYGKTLNIFTENELRILVLLDKGLTSEEISRTIFLSKHTIDKYRKKMLEKTCTTTTTQLLHHVRQLSLI